MDGFFSRMASALRPSRRIRRDGGLSAAEAGGMCGAGQHGRLPAAAADGQVPAERRHGARGLGALRNERGSMSLLGIGMVAMFIVLAIYLFYFYTVFIEKRQAQNVADAASLAAVETIKDVYEKALEGRAFQEAERLYDGEMDARRTPSPTPTPTPTPTPSNPAGLPGATVTPTPTPTPTPKPSAPPSQRRLFADKKLYDEIVEDRMHRRSGWMEDNWMRIVKERFFADEFTASRNGELLYDTIKHESGLIGGAAKETARRNEGVAGGSLLFPSEGKPKFLLESGRTLTIDAIGIREDIPALAAAGLNSKSIPIDVSGKVPFKIHW